MAGPINPKTGFSYDVPTKYTDGTPLVLTDIARYQVGIGQIPGTYSQVKDDVNFEQGRQLSPLSLFGPLAVGQWYGAVRAVTKTGKTSAWSTEAPFVIDTLTPEPPGNFLIA